MTLLFISIYWLGEVRLRLGPLALINISHESRVGLTTHDTDELRWERPSHPDRVQKLRSTVLSLHLHSSRTGLQLCTSTITPLTKGPKLAEEVAAGAWPASKLKCVMIGQCRFEAPKSVWFVRIKCRRSRDGALCRPYQRTFPTTRCNPPSLSTVAA